MHTDKELLRHMFDMRKSDVSRCMGPDFGCQKPAIRAHSIQNSNVLDIMEEDGHVICPKLQIEASVPPTVEFKPIGRNKASVFTGLCAEHDSSIFREIDTAPIEQGNLRQIALLTYRSVLKEFHASVSAATRLQMFYQKRVELGMDPGDKPSDSGIVAVSHMYKSWCVFRYKCRIEDMLSANDYSALKYKCTEIEQSNPTIAVSSFFGLDDSGLVKNICGVSLNVFPINQNKTRIVFSCLVRDHKRVKKEILKYIKKDTNESRQFISNLILNNCENIAFSPRYFKSIPVEIINYWEQYFMETAFIPKKINDDKRLMVFEKIA